MNRLDLLSEPEPDADLWPLETRWLGTSAGALAAWIAVLVWALLS